jgi:hypothetical protein
LELFQLFSGKNLLFITVGTAGHDDGDFIIFAICSLQRHPAKMSARTASTFVLDIFVTIRATQGGQR